MDASKAIQALADGDSGTLLQALDTDECAVVEIPGHFVVTVARIGTQVMAAQGPMVQGANAPDEDQARQYYAALLADVREWASEHVCPASDADEINPLWSDLSDLESTQEVDGGMF